MGDITKKIKLYEEASELARIEIRKDPELSRRTDLAPILDDAIRHEIKANVSDPTTIAAAAMRLVRQRFRT